MWAEWLNRVGIIFNSLAGFLVAPELLGISRLERTEARLEAFTHREISWLKARFFPFMEFQGGLPSSEALSYAPFVLASLAFWFFSWLAWHEQSRLLAIVPLAIYVALASVMLLLTHMAPAFKEWQRILGSIFFPLLYLTMAPFQAAYELFVFGGAKAAYRILDWLLDSLQGGDNRLRFLLVPVGIAFFILGNLLQFIATF
ncbi:MAG: hypothetical protein QOF89_615 [Acidobacteriota bacterium]|jgi:hypothetical protein|nr:hypothetical protein [Acidobacteriota bacterium]